MPNRPQKKQPPQDMSEAQRQEMKSNGELSPLPSLDQMWRKYWDAVKPQGVDETSIQYTETRRAYYAGIFEWLMMSSGETFYAHPEDDCVRYFERIKNEAMFLLSLERDRLVAKHQQRN